MPGVKERLHEAERGNRANLGAWDVSQVRDMGSMFSGAASFKGDISDWDVSGVEDMTGMFRGAASFNGDIRNWDVSGVQHMGWMFDGAAAYRGDPRDWRDIHPDALREALESLAWREAAE